MNNLKNPIVIASAIVSLLIAGLGLWFISTSSSPKISFVPVIKQNLTEEVSINGPVKSAAAVDLAFERSGKIARVNAQVGDVVSVGTILVSLERADLEAQLAGAEARLSELKNGARPEDIALTKTQVSNATAALDNANKGMTDKIQDAYTKSDQVIRNSVDKFFVNPASASPQISFMTSNSQAKIDAESGRLLMESILTSWRASLSSGKSTSIEAKKNLDQIRNFLATTNDALIFAVNGNGISQTMIDSWKVEVASDRTTINSVYSNITAGEDAVRNAESVLKIAQDQLVLKQAGASADQIAAQQAVVDGVQAQISKTVIRAPISGTVSRQDARVGIVASPNTPLISMISSAEFQVEADVSEVEVAKIHMGDKAIVTLSAYGAGTNFEATVVSVYPGATINQGVSNYRVVIQFKNKDERIKSGMTANAVITTAKKENALSIPWNSVIERSGTSFVLVKDNNQNTERKIQTGIRSGDRVEVVSGLKEGELVASFGINK